ncbi:glycoside hydrolase superfamily [Lineolata rhizophorae]|uniref:alpha-galactosidase n=1 Tax=Lineolata rhizophorae TaxID=578093 RepID=A0A6A6P2F1_9PEZI|nr:glycoside hydrolase superfamily [Lineolata rhizophorae]
MFSKQPHNAQLPFYRRKRVLLVLLGLVLVVVIVIAVGLGVGLTRGGGGEEEEGEAPTLPTRPPTPSEAWQPAVNSSWQIVLLSPLNVSEDATSVEPDVEVFDIDLFINDRETIDTLHRLNKKVICYFSAGSSEDWRPDFDDFDESDLGNDLDDWPGERWLNLSSPNVRGIMERRIIMAAEKGCDAVDPDNVDGYQNDNGLDLTEQDSVDMMAFLAGVTSRHQLSIGLKNAGDIIPTVLPIVQFSVNEQCVEYGECDTFRPFIEDNKPVFHIEYPSSAPSISQNTRQDYCRDSGDGDGSEEFSTVLKDMDLSGWVEYCSGMSATTQ